MSRVESVRLLRGLACAGIALAFGPIASAQAGDFSLLSESSVLGRNFGIPSVGPGVPETPVGEVDLVIETAWYFKNMELLGLDSVNGETLYGVLVPMRFLYRQSPRLRVEMGAVLGQDFGDSDRLSTTDPLFRLSFEATDDVFIIAGTILPTHWIHDAILDDTWKLRGPVEQGFQLRADRRHFKTDTWVNWRVKESQWDPEEFEIASANQFRVVDETLWLDLQAMWSHVGGQLTVSDRLENNLSFNVGASWGLDSLSQMGALSGFRLGAHLLHTRIDGRDFDTETGHGWEVAGALDFDLPFDIFGRIDASYFSGDEVRTFRGDTLYWLDDYTQLGGVLVFKPLLGLQIETGIAGQHTDDELNFSYWVNITWGGAFKTGVKPRLPEPRI
jgi:hypothetical protein